MTKVDLNEIKTLIRSKCLTPNQNLRKYLTRNPIKHKLIENFIGEIVQLLLTLKFQVMVDVGCGEGEILYYINKHNSKAITLGVDTSIEVLHLAREILGSNVDLVLADACNLPFRKVDAVMAIELLEHLSHPKIAKIAIEEMVRVADHVLVTVPYSTLYNTANLLSLKNIQSLGDDPNHKTAYDLEKLKQLLAPLHILVIKRVGVWVLALARVRKNKSA